MKEFFTNQQKLFLGTILLLVALNTSAWLHVFEINRPGQLTVDVFDVGQGDSIFIETPNKRHILIDGGPDSKVLGQLAKNLPFWQRKIDVVILTHPDADHLSGLLNVLTHYQVQYIVWTGVVRTGQPYQEWLRLISQARKRGTEIVIANAGDQVVNGNVSLSLLYPFENVSGQSVKVSNDAGIVSRLVYGNNEFLFTADISDIVEQALVSETMLASDVLKVGHHGSKYSSSPEFLQAVKPEFAAISVGADNSYGHPTKETLQRLSDFGIKILRTDQSGTIEFISDGKDIKVNH